MANGQVCNWLQQALLFLEIFSKDTMFALHQPYFYSFLFHFSSALYCLYFYSSLPSRAIFNH